MAFAEKFMPDPSGNTQEKKKSLVDSPHIVVGQYRLDSQLYLEAEIRPERYSGVSNHIIRVERRLSGGARTLEADKIQVPTLVDIDQFMRGNPHPKMYFTGL